MKNLQKSLHQQNFQNFHYKASWKLVIMTMEHSKIRNITKKEKEQKKCYMVLQKKKKKKTLEVK
jgi:hypothetical protein